MAETFLHLGQWEDGKQVSKGFWGEITLLLFKNIKTFTQEKRWIADLNLLI